MDTTLRDGEQTPDVSYTPAEKLQLARFLLDEVGVDRIEIASTRVSEGEREAARLVARWARGARSSPASRCSAIATDAPPSTGSPSTGGRVMNLLTKGSELHCRSQLGMEPAEHRAAVAQTLRHARRRKLAVNVYLEDWSSGVADSPDYVFAMVKQLRELGVARIYLPDTLGVLSPRREPALRR